MSAEDVIRKVLIAAHVIGADRLTETVVAALREHGFSFRYDELSVPKKAAEV